MMEEGDRNSSGHFDDLNKTLFGGDATLENLDGEEVEGEEEEGEPIEKEEEEDDESDDEDEDELPDL